MLDSDQPHVPDPRGPPVMAALARPLRLPVDGRQSPVAAGVQRGVRRFFAQLGQSSLPEFGLPNGRRADVIVLSTDGCLTIVEIKSSIQDFRVDRKWPDYREFCDRFFFAIPDTVPPEIIPDHAGLMIADAFGAAIMRDPPDHILAGARRKAITLRFARAAAATLHALADPGGVPDGSL